MEQIARFCNRVNPNYLRVPNDPDIVRRDSIEVECKQHDSFLPSSEVLGTAGKGVLRTRLLGNLWGTDDDVYRLFLGWCIFLP
jgi:hypothetical protein